MTDNTYRYFTPTGSDTFNAGWYLLDDDGLRQGNAFPLAAFAGADTIGTEGIMDIFTDDAGEPVDVSTALNKFFFITNLDYLDDFLGGADSISYEIA